MQLQNAVDIIITCSSISTTHYNCYQQLVRANGSDTESLEYYLNKTSNYFLSNHQLHMQPGIYYLNVDIVIEIIANFSFIGEDHCIIRCTQMST